MARFPVIAAAFALLFGITPAHAGDNWGENFRDWRTMCHSNGFCEAVTSDQNTAAGSKQVHLTIERTSINADGWIIALDFGKAAPDRDRLLSLTIDGGS
ncbi:MAG: hypothetical protein ACTSSQ_08995, partial [Alphaproteobacteria bacterium]